MQGKKPLPVILSFCPQWGIVFTGRFLGEVSANFEEQIGKFLKHNVLQNRRGRQTSHSKSCRRASQYLKEKALPTCIGLKGNDSFNQTSAKNNRLQKRSWVQINPQNFKGNISFITGCHISFSFPIKIRPLNSENPWSTC